MTEHSRLDGSRANRAGRAAFFREQPRPSQPFVTHWTCPFCKEEFNQKLLLREIEGWMRRKDCPKCDYHNPFLTGSMEFVMKFCEPC